MEHLPDLPYPEHQGHEFHPPTYPSNYSSKYPSFPNYPQRTYPSETGDHFPTCSNEDQQIQHEAYYPDLSCPDQSPCPPQSPQSFGYSTEELNYANSIEAERERVIAFQRNTQSRARTDTEIVMKMQLTYEEQQSDLDIKIRQVALLTEMIGELGKSRAESEMHGNDEEEMGMKGVEKESPDEAKKKIKAVNLQPCEEETSAEEESVSTPPDDHEQRKLPEWAHDEKARQKAARAVYWVQLQPWLVLFKEGKPPEPGVRPKEKRKIQGTYKNHKKRWGAVVV